MQFPSPPSFSFGIPARRHSRLTLWLRILFHERRRGEAVMHIVFAASECVPFAKTGGLADVVGALPPELVKLGNEVTVYLPLYAVVRRHIDGELNYKLRSITIPFESYNR